MKKILHMVKNFIYGFVGMWIIMYIVFSIIGVM